MNRFPENSGIYHVAVSLFWKPVNFMASSNMIKIIRLYKCIIELSYFKLVVI